jgi:hypothetical protein
MPFDIPNIVPANNLRLPDALTIKYGPARLLSRFVMAGDRAARDHGVRLRIRYDFDELVYVNKQQVTAGTWFPLVNMFDPQYCDLNRENSYWICGENDAGEVVLTQAGRIYSWPDTNLEEQARLMFYGGRETGQKCQITADIAHEIGGVVFCAGSHWIHPDFRGHQLSELTARLGRAYAAARWPIEWAIALITPALVKKGVARGYGYKHTSRSVFYPGSYLGDLELVIAYLSADETYEDLAMFLSDQLSDSAETVFGSPLPPRPFDHNVTSTSSERVFHGSNNRSYRVM